MFTSMFALEMLLKLLACGPLGYIQNPYNIFDGVIVVIRWVPASRPATGCLEAPVSEGAAPLAVCSGGYGDAQWSPFPQAVQGTHT